MATSIRALAKGGASGSARDVVVPRPGRTRCGDISKAGHGVRNRRNPHIKGPRPKPGAARAYPAQGGGSDLHGTVQATLPCARERLTQRAAHEWACKEWPKWRAELTEEPPISPFPRGSGSFVSTPRGGSDETRYLRSDETPRWGLARAPGGEFVVGSGLGLQGYDGEQASGPAVR